MRTLLLGPGKSRHRVHGGRFFDASDNLTVIDHSQAVLDDWTEAEKRIKADLSHPPFGLTEGAYTEVHAYEVLNLLPGDATSFFLFWRTMWACMVPGGRFFATVPHWKSQWIHAYPAPQRTYTFGLLSYLDRADKNPAKEAFPEWPEPYDFTVDSAYEVGEPPQGFIFTLKKR